jgi:hypothetical protein
MGRRRRRVAADGHDQEGSGIHESIAKPPNSFVIHGWQPLHWSTTRCGGGKLQGATPFADYPLISLGTPIFAIIGG